MIYLLTFVFGNLTYLCFIIIKSMILPLYNTNCGLFKIKFSNVTLNILLRIN